MVSRYRKEWINGRRMGVMEEGWAKWREDGRTEGEKGGVEGTMEGAMVGRL